MKTNATQRLAAVTAKSSAPLSDADTFWGTLAHFLIGTEALSEKFESTKVILTKIESASLLKRLKDKYKEGYFVEKKGTLDDLYASIFTMFGWDVNDLDGGPEEMTMWRHIRARAKKMELDAADMKLVEQARKDFLSFQG